LASDVAAAAKRRKRKRNLPTEEEVTQLPSDASTYSFICTYWAANPASDPQIVLLRRLFFLNASKNNYVTVSFYPARGYLPLVEFGDIRSCGPKAIILADEQVYTLAQCLPDFADSMCKEGKEVVPPTIKCESDNFRLGMPIRRRGLTRLYVDSEYICLTSLDQHYLARMFNIVHQQMPDYVAALPDLLSYVTMSLASVVYVEPMPNASAHINYPHLQEELV